MHTGSWYWYFDYKEPVDELDGVESKLNRILIFKRIIHTDIWYWYFDSQAPVDDIFKVIMHRDSWYGNFYFKH